MAENARPTSLNLLPKLHLDGNVHENWIRFKLRFLVYLTASGNDVEVLTEATMAVKKKISRQKAMLLSNVAGEDAIDLTSTFGLSDKNLDDFDKFVEVFDKYAAPKGNEMYKHYIFNQCYQQEEETFDHFLTEATKTIQNCEYGDQADSMLRDRIVVGLRDSKLREALLRIDDLKLDQAVRDCRAAEQSKAYDKKLEEKDNTTVSIDAVQSSRGKPQVRAELYYQKYTYKIRLNRVPTPVILVLKNIKMRAMQITPIGCVETAAGHTNMEKGHFFKQCWRLKQKPQVYAVSEDQCQSNICNSIYCDHIKMETAAETQQKEWKQSVLFKLDIGLEVNILPEEIYKWVKGNSKMHKTNATIVPHGGATLTPLGIVEYMCIVAGVAQPPKFIVLKTTSCPILGIEACMS
ncbi:hypothetical protein PR048_011810 [Dryococelus australis]|uniref:Uncharacterized protein n=1 Tax=Dryococelus australis TaxID=614101 RepID=A0ABQ9HMQ8_9NEOP|nr:hypothetical protein PR048_011810 [Dryococelus australis]